MPSYTKYNGTGLLPQEIKTDKACSPSMVISSTGGIISDEGEMGKREGLE